MVDLSDVGYVHRITVGSRDPENRMSDEQCAAAMAQLNRCLSGSPKGMLIGVEKNTVVVPAGEHHGVVESISYHVGFRRRPPWLD